MAINESLNDTPDDVEKYRMKLLAGLSPEERFSRMNRLCAFGTLAMLEGLREKILFLQTKNYDYSWLS